MNKVIFRSVAVITTICFLFSFDMPKGWRKAGNAPDKYDMGIAQGAGQNGQNAATIKSTSDKIRGFGTLMQSCSPDKYRGKRVKMTGLLKAAFVEDWSAFWFRIDGENKRKSLSFDNMYDRHISGTTDWRQCEIILDVPYEATNMAYGALLSGTGQIWFTDIKFEIVDDKTPTTQRLSEPTNLNFTEK